MSLVAACEPFGRCLMRVQTVRKVPHVQGKSSEFRYEFIDGTGWFVWGCDRFWMRRNFPGFPAFGTSDRGDDWKGPISRLSSSCENGPRYLPLSNSDCIISLKASSRISVESLLGGVYERCICGMPASAPCHMYKGIIGYLVCSDVARRSVSHWSATSGVCGLRLLCETAFLSTV